MEQKLYIIHSHENYYKIGVSQNVDQRVYQLQKGNLMRLRTITTFDVGVAFAHDVEKKIHKLLHSRKAEGEWFVMTKDELQTLIKAIPDIIKQKEKEAIQFRSEIPGILASLRRRYGEK